MGIEEFLKILPSMKGLERDFQIEEIETLGINPCGNKLNGKEIYKLLTKEGYMLTYLKDKKTIKYHEKVKIHK